MSLGSFLRKFTLNPPIDVCEICYKVHMDCTTKAYQQTWARLKTIFGRYYLVAYSAPPKSNILDDPLDSQITIVSKTAVFLRPRWLVVTISSVNPFLPSYPLQIFLPGTVAASCSIQNFGPCMHSGGWPFYSSQGHLNLITWYFILTKIHDVWLIHVHDMFSSRLKRHQKNKA